jgi:hypothetical protein
MNEPSADRPDDSERLQTDRSAANRLPEPRAATPRLELSAPIHPGSRPFAWQHGARLYLLVNQARGWVLAELEFLAAECRYVETRRTRYRWPREAIGVLLTRSLAADEETSRRLAKDVTDWLATVHHVAPVWHHDVES